MTRLAPVLIGIFALSQALRDVYFAAAFQGISPFVVIVAAFGVSVAVCGARMAIRSPQQAQRVRAEWRAFVWMNLTTALAWIAYFFALKQLQPSIVNTLHSAMGPLTALLLGALIVKGTTTHQLERICYAGLAATIGLLAWITLTGRTGLATASVQDALGAFLLPLVSGASITTSLLLTKRMSERGIGVDAITVFRYPLIILIALVVLALDERHRYAGSIPDLLELAVAAALLVALPLYLLQIGIAGTGALSGHVIRSLGPVFVFALELMDRRIGYSGATLACILLYCGFTIGANLARAYHVSSRSVR